MKVIAYYIYLKKNRLLYGKGITAVTPCPTLAILVCHVYNIRNY